MLMEMDKSKLAVEIFDKHAADYMEKYMNVQQYHPALEVFCRCVEKVNARVLELACGPGNVTQFLLKERPDFEILGTDLAENMISLAQSNNPTASFRRLDCRNILELNDTFDAIVCAFGLPYLSRSEAEQLIVDSAKILHENGVLYLSTMEGNYADSGFQKGSKGDEIYIYYHEAAYLIACLLENGFEVILKQNQDFEYSNELKFNDLLLVAKKK